MLSRVFFYICWLIIGLCSSIDVYLTIKYAYNLPKGELNPIARMILINDGWDISRFIGIKVFMTILVLGILRWILYFHPKIALTCAAVLAVFQAVLVVICVSF